MTIGKSSKKNKASKFPPYLDRADGFYGRLDETESGLRDETIITKQQAAPKPGTGDKTQGEYSTGSDLPDEQQYGVFDFNEGMLEDDGTTLLKRKPSRLSQRWSRKSSKRAKSDKTALESQSVGTETEPASLKNLGELTKGNSLMESTCRTSEHLPVHFSVREDADDQILITQGKVEPWEIDQKKKDEIAKEEDVAEMKVIKRSSFRNYRKILDKALRRGWESFVANLNSVTLAPIPSASSSPTKAEMDRKNALANFR